MGFRVWWQAVRAYSFPPTLIAVTLGAIIAWTHFDAPVNLGTFFLSVAGALAIHAATNMANDYIDFREGVDDLPEDLLSPFTGGSRVLPDGLVSPARYRQAFLLLYAIGAALGIYLALTIPSGWVILLLGWIAGPLTFFYTYPPLKLQYHALGEILVGVVFGPILVFGAFFVQTSLLTWEPVFASIPVGLVISAFLLINEIPERETDPRGGKRTLPSRVGVTSSIRIYTGLVLVAFAWVAVAVVLNWLPLAALAALLAAPLGVRAVLLLRRTEGRFPDHLPANGMTILTAQLLGLLLIAAYLGTAALSP